MTPVGNKGQSTVPNCAESCNAMRGCLAFHVFMDARDIDNATAPCDRGDCYVHTAPLGRFQANRFAVLYIKRSG